MCGKRGVSLIEIILAVVILGLVAVVTLPRLSRAAASPDSGAQLRADLKILRVAIERYYQDHVAYPGQQGDGMHPARTPEATVAQLTRYTNERGQTADRPDASHRFGPYLRDGIMPCPVAVRADLTGVRVVVGTVDVGHFSAADDTGWIYNCETGQIAANSAANDAAGRRYASY